MSTPDRPAAADRQSAADSDAQSDTSQPDTSQPDTPRPDAPEPDAQQNNHQDNPTETPENRPPDAQQESPHRMVIAVSITAVVLTLAVIATAFILVRGASTEASNDTGRLAVAAAPAPGAASRWCTDLDRALPDELGDAARRTLANPTAGVAAWGNPAVILRCGLADPAELTCHAQLTQFTDASGATVSWLRLSDPSAVTYIAVDRPVRIAVTLPPGTGIDTVQQLSTIIAAALPARPVCTKGTVTPADNT